MSATDLGWEDAAAGWERQRPFLATLGAPVTTRLLELLAPRPGERILELACGNGEVGLETAPLLDHGTLIQSDLEPAMVAAAEREAARRGLTGITHRVLDAERLELADGSVDGIVCRFGYMLTDDPVAALTESARVLRPGGRVALAVWAESTRNPWGTVVRRALVEHELVDPPDPGAPGPFRLGGPGALEEALQSAGLSPTTVDDVPVVFRLPAVSEFWGVTLDLSTVTRAVIAGLDEGVTAAVRREVEDALAPYVDRGELAIPGLARVGLARREA